MALLQMLVYIKRIFNEKIKQNTKSEANLGKQPVVGNSNVIYIDTRA